MGRGEKEGKRGEGGAAWCAPKAQLVAVLGGRPSSLVQMLRSWPPWGLLRVVL